MRCRKRIYYTEKQKANSNFAFIYQHTAPDFDSSNAAMQNVVAVWARACSLDGHSLHATGDGRA